MSKFIAIDLAPEGVFAVGGTARGGSARVEQAVAWDGSDGEAPPALSAETAKLIGERLRDRLRAAGVAPAPVLVSVGRGRVILKELRYPAVPPADEPNVVRFQALKELSDSPDDLVLDYTPLSNGAPEGERRSTAVVIRKELFGAIQAMCAAAGLKLAAVTPRPYAVAAGLTRGFAAGQVTAPESKSDAVATLVLGPAGGEFTVVRNGEVTFTREVPGPVAASEPMLLADVRRNLTMYAGSAPGHPVQALYVAEAGGRWAGRLRSALGIPVHAYDPLAGALPDFPEALRGRFAGAAGLLAAKAADAVPINFAAPRQPRLEKDPKQAKLLAAAAVALLLVLAGGAYGYFALDAADEELARLQQQKTKLEEDAAKRDPDARRLDAARKWQGRRVVWLDELFDTTVRFRNAQGAYGVSFWGKALPPDQKTAALPNQGALEVKLSARGPDAANALVEALQRDNTGKSPYYVAPDKNVVGQTPGDSSSRDYTVTSKVNARPAEQYTNTPPFTPPGRKGYPPPPGPARAPAEPEVHTAPDPKVKGDPKDVDPDDGQ